VVGQEGSVVTADDVERGKQLFDELREKAAGKQALPETNGQRRNEQHRDDPGPTEPTDHEPGSDRDGDGDVERRIHFAMTKLRVGREANRRLDAEEHPPLVLPPVKSLTELLAEPDPPVRYRIDQLAPADGRIILSAQWKAGKTIVVGNLLRSLVDGDPFLGHFTVTSPASRVVLIDDELSERTVRIWLREQGIVNTDAVADVIPLRGKASAFNLLDDRCRAQWVQRLTDLGCDYLILDCLRPILDALGLDENHDAGKFLVHYDALLTEATIGDSTLVHHMGHTNERARGDSRLQDWPDAIWRLVRENPDDPTSPRYFSAYGRDVEVPEGRLSYDPVTRHLTYAAGSRTDAKTEAAMKVVIRLLVQEGKPISKNHIEELMAGGDHPQKAIRAGIAQAIEQGFVTIPTDVARGTAKPCRIAYPCSACGWPVASRRDRHESCSSETREWLE
jgi:hypothetical protein